MHPSYDGHDVVMDDNSGTLTKYQNGPGIDNKLTVRTGTDVKYFLADHLGSTNGLADSSGAVTSQASYDAFGIQTGNLASRYGFTGRENDSFTGLMHYRARQYDPKIGRFISEDPIGFAGGDINLYGYVRNMPLWFRDPTGLQPGADVMAYPPFWQAVASGGWSYCGGGIFDCNCCRRWTRTRSRYRLLSGSVDSESSFQSIRKRTLAIQSIQTPIRLPSTGVSDPNRLPNSPPSNSVDNSI